MVALLFICFLASAVVTLLLVRKTGAHARIYGEALPQRFHAGHIPRIGGIGIVVGCFAGWTAATIAPVSYFNVYFSWNLPLALAASLAPAVLVGVYEDITQRVPVRYRLLLTLVSAGLACAALDLKVTRLDLPWVDSMLAMMPWASTALALFAIGGLPHAFNIIDGYNGLCATVALLICLAIGHVALQLGDRQLAALALCVAGATVGFLVWNYPRGLIFAGDGGAYFWGGSIAVISILLVQRHPIVSPWFPMLLLVYPVFETFFSIYRKLARGHSPGLADALHFHQLIYRRIVRAVVNDDASRRMLVRNNRTSPYLWSFTLLTVVPAMIFWRNTGILMLLCLLFVVTYIAAYLTIVRFKVPKWLRGR
ncbi:MAG: glycosyl transferase [Comamonadaceae bacterium]|nr:MAG: glycosyl transferase [Comamonadaceae bacterium]